MARVAAAVEEERGAEVLVDIDLQPVGALKPDDVPEYRPIVQASLIAVAQESGGDLLGGIAQEEVLGLMLQAHGLLGRTRQLGMHGLGNGPDLFDSRAELHADPLSQLVRARHQDVRSPS